VQTEADILAAKADKYQAINKLMDSTDASEDRNLILFIFIIEDQSHKNLVMRNTELYIFAFEYDVNFQLTPTTTYCVCFDQGAQ